MAIKEIVWFNKINAVEGIEGIEEGSYVAGARHYLPNVASPLELSGAQEVNIKAGETSRIDLILNSGKVEGTVSGLQNGQQAFVALLDGSVDVSSLTSQAIQSMEEQVLAVMPVPQNGPFTFENVPEGNYVLGAAAVPAGATPSSIAPAAPAIAAGKFAAVEIQVVAGETVTVDLALP